MCIRDRRLWSRPLDPDYVVHNISKLATNDAVVFAEGGTLRMLEAATGRQVGAFSAPPEATAAGDTDWKWIAREADVLWAAFGPPDSHVAPHRRRQKMGHWPWTVANEQYKGIVNNFGAARRLAAFKYPGMKLLWSVSESEPFDARALCIEGNRIFELAPGRYVAARDSATGAQLWRKTPETSRALFAAIGNSLKRQGWGLGWATYCWARAKDGVVCIAGPSFRKTIAVDFKKGELLWSADISSGHPFFFGDALYIVPRVANPSAFCRKIDPMTGKVLDEFKVSTGMPGYETPPGEYRVVNRARYAYSKKYEADMYNWLGLTRDGGYGIHSLKGSGYEHWLGKRASHGCIRLSRKDAQYLFPLIPLGTTVRIVNRLEPLERYQPISDEDLRELIAKLLGTQRPVMPFF